MFRLKAALVTFLAAGLVIVVAAAVMLVPLWTGPGLPPGAMRLHIATVSGPRFGCPTALLAPVRIATSDDELILVSVASGDMMPVVWPSGFAAWRIDGRAELVGPYGNVIGRDGDVLDSLGGGAGPDGVSYVCGIGEGFAGLVVVAPWVLLAVSIALGIVIVGVPRLLANRRRARARVPSP